MSHTTVTHNPDGWPLAPNRYGYPGFEMCGATQTLTRQGLPACETPPVWRVQKFSGRYTWTSYFCDEHLPTEQRPVSNR